MSIQLWDWIIFTAFFVVVVGVSVWKSRRAKDHKENSSDYFLAGRGLTWPLIGISIVAANISTEQMVGMAGQAAGDVGLAVSAWQLVGSLGIVIIAMTLLPRFLQAGIYTMPEFLEYRYNPTARGIMAILTVVIYVLILVTAVIYSGGVVLRAVADIPMTQGVLLVGLIGVAYAAVGGLKAIAWADLVQGLALIAGGLLVFFLGLNAVGGWDSFVAHNSDKLHMILPSDDPTLPWTGIASGLWIVIIYYCGLNQFIIQRNLAAKTLRHGQLGMIFAGALWLLVPFAIVMPGIIASQLFGDQMVTADEAFPMLIHKVVGPGLRGFIYAAIAGAVTSSLASMLNSASTIAVMDVYKRMINPSASQSRLVWLGRALTIVFVVIGCILAPGLDDPKFKGVFQYIQQFQGYIWPGVVAAFLLAFILPRAPGSAGVTALIAGPIIYGVFQFTTDLHGLHFLIQVCISFLLVCLIMTIIAFLRPLDEPRTLPVRENFDMKPSWEVGVFGGLVIAAVIAFFIVFR